MSAGAIMGIYDREYYRDETRGSGWLSGEAPACRAIIAINIACFVAQKLVGSEFDTWFLDNPDLVFHKYQVWRLLTNTFLHAAPLHILFNMVFLWMVGKEMESFYGSRDFVALYVSAAIVSSLIADTFNLWTGHGGAIGLGASGAITAIMVLYTSYYPRREILLFMIVPIQMWAFLAGYLSLQLLQALSARGTGHDDFMAHLGGAAFGYLYKVGDLRLSRLEKMFKRRPRLRIVSGEPRESSKTTRSSSGPTWTTGSAASARPSPTAVITEEQFDEKLDQILIKIAKEGKGSLTDDENRILEEASRRARNRRSERF